MGQFNMSISNVKSGKSGGMGDTSAVSSESVKVASNDGKEVGSDDKSGVGQMKAAESNQSSSMQPVGAGRPHPQTNVQQKQKNHRKSSGEVFQNEPAKCGQAENTKHRNNQQKGNCNLSRGSSLNSLTGKMNNLSISGTRRPSPEGGPSNSNNSGHHINNAGHNSTYNHQNRPQDGSRNQNHWQSQGVNYVNHANNRPMMSPQNQHHFFPNTPHQKHPGSPTQLMQVQAFPPISHRGNEFRDSHMSAPNSPQPGQQMYPDFPHRFPGQNNFRNESHHSGPNVPLNIHGNSPNGQQMSNVGVLSTPNSYGTQVEIHDGRNLDQNQPKFFGSQSKNNPRNLDGHNQKKQGNKMWKKNNYLKGKRQSHPGAVVPNNKVMDPVCGPDRPQYFNNQEVFMGPPNYVPTSVPPPPISPVTAVPFQQYIDEQQYSVAIYQGGNYVPQQQWAPVPGNFVPYTTAEIVPFSVPGAVPQHAVPYPGAANMPFTNGPMVPYTAVPYTSVAGLGFAPAVPPPANVSAQVLSFTVSSRVEPSTASSRVEPSTATMEVPKQQFSLSQLERAWEENPRKPVLNNLPESNETVSSEQQLPDQATTEPEWLPEKLRKMLDVSSLEKLQKMSSTNGKRVPHNARNKDSPNHMPTASSPDVQDDVIKFICDSWNKVYQEYQKGTGAVAFHVDSDPCTLPEGFVPFDLEAYWGKRLVQNMTTQNIPTQNL